MIFINVMAKNTSIFSSLFSVDHFSFLIFLSPSLIVFHLLPFLLIPLLFSLLLYIFFLFLSFLLPPIDFFSPSSYFLLSPSLLFPTFTLPHHLHWSSFFSSVLILFLFSSSFLLLLPLPFTSLHFSLQLPLLSSISAFYFYLYSLLLSTLLL